MRLGLGLGFNRRSGGGSPISAVERPSLAPLADGDTIAVSPADWNATTNYSSTEGTIASAVGTLTLNGSPADAGDPVEFEDVVALEVVVTDSEGNARTFRANRTVAGIAPTNDTAPSIAGDTGLGDTLTVTAGSWSGVPAPDLSYQWRRDGAPIAGETGTTYDIALADSGADIDVLETAVNIAGSAAEASNAIAADTFSAPAITGVPTISGTASVGETLTAAPASVAGNPTPDRAWQWLRDGAAISGAVAATYEIVEADEGAKLSVRQVETNALGADDAVSAETEEVTDEPPSGPAFDLAALFPTGTRGFALVPGSQWTDLYQERTGSAATTVAGPDDPVGTAHDKVLDIYYTAPSDAARPIYKTAGGLSWLEFDGVDDVLLRLEHTMHWQDAHWYLAAEQISGAASGGRGVLSFGVGTGGNSDWGAGGGMVMHSRNEVGNLSTVGGLIAPVPLNTPLRVYEAELNRSTASPPVFQLRTNGADENSRTPPDGPVSEVLGRVIFGARSGSDAPEAFYHVKIFAAVCICRELPTADVVAAREYVAERGGIEL